MKVVDTRGYSCPEPVLMTRNALTKDCPLSVLVDSETPKQNITRFAENNGYLVSSKEDGAGGYELTISK